MAIVRKRVDPNEWTMRVVQPEPMTVQSGRNITGLHPELVRRWQEGTLALDPWYIRHPVLTVGGVVAAGGLVYLIVRHLRKE